MGIVGRQKDGTPVGFGDGTIDGEPPRTPSGNDDYGPEIEEEEPKLETTTKTPKVERAVKKRAEKR